MHVSILSVLSPGTVLVSMVRKAVLVKGLVRIHLYMFIVKRKERVGKEMIYNRVGG